MQTDNNRPPSLLSNSDISTGAESSHFYIDASHRFAAQVGINRTLPGGVDPNVFFECHTKPPSGTNGITTFQSGINSLLVLTILAFLWAIGNSITRKITITLRSELHRLETNAIEREKLRLERRKPSGTALLGFSFPSRVLADSAVQVSLEESTNPPTMEVSQPATITPVSHQATNIRRERRRDASIEWKTSDHVSELESVYRRQLSDRQAIIEDLRQQLVAAQSRRSVTPEAEDVLKTSWEDEEKRWKEKETVWEGQKEELRRQVEVTDAELSALSARIKSNQVRIKELENRLEEEEEKRKQKEREESKTEHSPAAESPSYLWEWEEKRWIEKEFAWKEEVEQLRTQLENARAHSQTMELVMKANESANKSATVEKDLQIRSLQRQVEDAKARKEREDKIRRSREDRTRKDREEAVAKESAKWRAARDQDAQLRMVEEKARKEKEELLNKQREEAERKLEEVKVENECLADLRKEENWQRATFKEKHRCLQRDIKLWGRRRWTSELALSRFNLLTEEFDSARFSETKPLTAEVVPWPVLTDPFKFQVEDLDWKMVEEFFTFVKGVHRDQPGNYNKFVEKVQRMFHPNRWGSRGLLFTIEDDATRKSIERAGNVVAQAVTPMWRKSKGYDDSREMYD